MTRSNVLLLPVVGSGLRHTILRAITHPSSSLCGFRRCPHTQNLPVTTESARNLFLAGQMKGPNLPGTPHLYRNIDSSPTAHIQSPDALSPSIHRHHTTRSDPISNSLEMCRSGSLRAALLLDLLQSVPCHMPQGPKGTLNATAEHCNRSSELP